MLVAIFLVIIVIYSFSLFLLNSYAQIDIPRTYANFSQLQRIDQTVATYAIIMTPGSASQNNPYHYYPEFSAIPANTTVLWYNNNTNQVHTVVSGLPGDPDSGQLFSSDVIPYDSYFKYTFTKAGNYSYHCELHPWKVGYITVNDKVVRNGDFEISSGTGNTLDLAAQDRVLLKFRPVSLIEEPTKSTRYNVTIFRDAAEVVFSDLFNVTGNGLQLDLVPSNIPARVVGPDFIKPTTGAYHVEGRFLTQSGNYLIKIQIAPMENKPLERSMQGEYTIRIMSGQ
jgi:plastocyanin